MATNNQKNQWKEDFIDKLVNLIFTEYPNFNPQEYQKKLNPITGQIGNEEEGNIVLYQEDYQNYGTEFDEFIEVLSSCFCQGEFITNDEGETVCSSSYIFIDPATQMRWEHLSEENGQEYTWDEESWVVQFVNNESCAYSPDDPYSRLSIDDTVLTFISQFITFDKTTPLIDSEKAKEILDTTIFELIPRQVTRQERINKIFSEINLLIGDVPEFNFDVDSDGINDTWSTELETNQNNHSSTSDIIFNPEDGNIVRLDRNAEEQSSNVGQTVESLRNQLNTYLTDIDKKIDPTIVDERPDYEEKAPGYIKIRNLNQSIIIRNQEGGDVGLIGADENDPKWLDTGFTVTMWVKFLTKKQGGTLFNFGNPYRKNNPKGFSLETFSIHRDSQVREDKLFTWKEYIDCKSELDWINQDNYDEEYNAHMQKCVDVGVYNSLSSNYNEYFSSANDYFEKSDYERFIRLVVREAPSDEFPRGPIRDSHVGMTKGKEGYVSKRIKTADPQVVQNPDDDPDDYYYDNEDDPKSEDARSNKFIDVENFQGTIPTAPLWTLGNAENENYDETHYYPNKILQYTRVPIDFNEWFFIVANYNPNIDEDASTTYRGSCGSGDDCGPNALTSLQYYSDFWRGNVERGGYVLQSDDEAILNLNSSLNPGDGIGSFTHYSGFGAKCKVEFISKSDLLRARGYKT